MSLASRLKALGFAAALLASPIALAGADNITPEIEAVPRADTGVKARLRLIGHRRPHQSDVSRDIMQEPVARTEQEFDRSFGMCRRC